MRTQWLISNHFLRSDSIHVKNVFKSARDEMKRLNKGRRALAWHKTIKLFIWKLLLSLLRAAREAPQSSADKFECQNKTTQRSKLQASNYFSSNTRLINKMGRRRYRVSKCRHKRGAVRGWRQNRSDVPPHSRLSLASTTISFLSNWLTSMASEFVAALCA